MFKSLIETVLRFTVLLRARDEDTFQICLLLVFQLDDNRDLATCGNRTSSTSKKVLVNTRSTKRITAVQLKYRVIDQVLLLRTELTDVFIDVVGRPTDL